MSALSVSKKDPINETFRTNVIVGIIVNYATFKYRLRLQLVNTHLKRIIPELIDNYSIYGKFSAKSAPTMRKVRTLDIGQMEFEKKKDYRLGYIVDLSMFGNIVNLDMSHSNVKIIPSSSCLKHLKHLNVSNTQICELPQEMTELTYLNTLNSSVRVIPETYINLNELHTGGYVDNYGSHHLVDKLPEKSVNITILVLLVTKVTNIPETYTKLKFLKITDNYCMETLSKNFVKLNCLHVCHCIKMTEIPETYVNLESLTIKTSPIYNIPSTFLQLKHLKILFCTNFPNDLEYKEVILSDRLTNIETLEFDSNVEIFPENCRKLRQIQLYPFVHNFITETQLSGRDDYFGRKKYDNNSNECERNISFRFVSWKQNNMLKYVLMPETIQDKKFIDAYRTNFPPKLKCLIENNFICTKHINMYTLINPKNNPHINFGWRKNGQFMPSL